MTINIYSSPRYKFSKKKFKSETSNLLLKFGIDGDFILNLIFVGRRKAKELSIKFNKGNTARPVLSFSYYKEKINADEDNILGEIIICYPLAILLAAERNKSVDTTITGLIEHGIRNIIA